MSNDRAARKARMTAAAAARTSPEAPPAGQTAIRTRNVRVTLNIPPELFRKLNHWTGATADQLDVPRVPVQDALRAMIEAVTADDVCGLVVTDLLRRALAEQG